MKIIVELEIQAPNEYLNDFVTDLRGAIHDHIRHFGLVRVSSVKLSKLEIHENKDTLSND